MRTIQYTLTGIGLVAVVAISMVTMQAWIPAALAQHAHGEQAEHGHGTDAADHFHALVEHLDLSEEQQESLAEPFHEAYAAMQKLHELHDVIADQLTDEQRNKLAHMIHEMLGGSLAGQAHEHGAPHEAHH